MCHFPEKAGIVLDSGGWKKMESENAHYFKYFEFNLKFILLIRPAPFWIQSFEILFHPILTDTSQGLLCLGTGTFQFHFLLWQAAISPYKIHF